MRYSHSYSKRGTLDSCLRKYFFEYYASAKRLPFDAERKELIQGLKHFTGAYMLAGDILHWFIEQYLKKRASAQNWAERTALGRFDRAVRYSRDPVRMAHMRDDKYPPPMLIITPVREDDPDRVVEVLAESNPGTAVVVFNDRAADNAAYFLLAHGLSGWRLKRLTRRQVQNKWHSRSRGRNAEETRKAEQRWKDMITLSAIDTLDQAAQLLKSVKGAPIRPSPS